MNFIYEISAELKHDNYLVRIYVCAESLNEFGMVCDFYELKELGEKTLSMIPLGIDSNRLVEQLRREFKLLLDRHNHRLGRIEVEPTA